jgi:sugar phosphate isomerase/epimerase
MKISFTSLGCPGWDLDTICRRGQEYGYDGVDFRGYLDTIDVTTLPLFTTQVAEVRRKLADAGLATSGISTSIKVCDADLLEKNLEEARRTIDLANGLGTSNLRVFGGGDLNRYSREELSRVGCDTVEQLLALDGASELHWLFETHDNWIKASDCRLLLDNIPNPAFGALWDMGHTPRVGGETPQETYDAIGPRVGYTHIKDAVFDPNHPQAMSENFDGKVVVGWRYTIPGSGQLPLAEAIALLKSKGYDGWLMFEHEKRWHPDLLEPEDILPAYANWVRTLI